MYSIAFFEYGDGINKLYEFVGNRFHHKGAVHYLADVALWRPSCLAGQSGLPERATRLRSWKDLPNLSDEGHSYFWFLHNEESSTPPYDPGLLFPLYTGTSFVQINTLFQTVARRYRWVLFPWGGAYGWNMCAFLSPEVKLRDRFLSCTLAASPEQNTLIASYDVSGRFETVGHSILFEEFNAAGHRVWETCHGDKIPPYVVSSEVFHHDGAPEGYFEDLNIFTYHSGYVQAAEATYDALGPLGVCDLYVYRPRTKAAFLAMLNRRFPSDPSFDPTHLARPEPAAVLPGTTPWATMQALLKKLSYSEEPLTLSASPVCLAHVPWFYATSCGDGYYYSLFVTQDSSQLTTLVALSGEENFRLIACF